MIGSILSNKLTSAPPGTPRAAATASVPASDSEDARAFALSTGSGRRASDIGSSERYNELLGGTAGQTTMKASGAFTDEDDRGKSTQSDKQGHKPKSATLTGRLSQPSHGAVAGKSTTVNRSGSVTVEKKSSVDSSRDKSTKSASIRETGQTRSGAVFKSASNMRTQRDITGRSERNSIGEDEGKVTFGRGQILSDHGSPTDSELQNLSFGVRTPSTWSNQPPLQRTSAAFEAFTTPIHGTGATAEKDLLDSGRHASSGGDLAEALKVEKQRLATAKRQTQDACAKAEEAIANADSERRQREQAESREAELQQELAKLRALLIRTDDELSIYRLRAGDSDVVIAEMRLKSDDDERANRKLRDELRRLQEQQSDFQSVSQENSELRTEIAKLRDSETTQQEENASGELEATIRENESLRTELQRLRIAMESESQQGHQEVDEADLTIKVTVAETECRRLQDVERELCEEVAHLSDVEQELRLEVERLVDIEQELRVVITDTVEERDTLQLRLEEEHERVSALEDQVIEQRERAEDLDAELDQSADQYRLDMSRAQEEHDKLQHALQQRTDRVTSLEADVESLRGQLQEQDLATMDLKGLAAVSSRLQSIEANMGDMMRGVNASILASEKVGRDFWDLSTETRRHFTDGLHDLRTWQEQHTTWAQSSVDSQRALQQSCFEALDKFRKQLGDTKEGGEFHQQRRLSVPATVDVDVPGGGVSNSINSSATAQAQSAQLLDSVYHAPAPTKETTALTHRRKALKMIAKLTDPDIVDLMAAVKEVAIMADEEKQPQNWPSYFTSSAKSELRMLSFSGDIFKSPFQFVHTFWLAGHLHLSTTSPPPLKLSSKGWAGIGVDDPAALARRWATEFETYRELLVQQKLGGQEGRNSGNELVIRALLSSIPSSLADQVQAQHSFDGASLNKMTLAECSLEWTRILKAVCQQAETLSAATKLAPGYVPTPIVEPSPVIQPIQAPVQPVPPPSQPTQVPTQPSLQGPAKEVRHRSGTIVYCRVCAILGKMNENHFDRDCPTLEHLPRHLRDAHSKKVVQGGALQQPMRIHDSRQSGDQGQRQDDRRGEQGHQGRDSGRDDSYRGDRRRDGNSGYDRRASGDGNRSDGYSDRESSKSKWIAPFTVKSLSRTGVLVEDMLNPGETVELACDRVFKFPRKFTSDDVAAAARHRNLVTVAEILKWNEHVDKQDAQFLVRTSTGEEIWFYYRDIHLCEALKRWKRERGIKFEGRIQSAKQLTDIKKAGDKVDRAIGHDQRTASTPFSSTNPAAPLLPKTTAPAAGRADTPTPSRGRPFRRSSAMADSNASSAGASQLASTRSVKGRSDRIPNRRYADN